MRPVSDFQVLRLRNLALLGSCATLRPLRCDVLLVLSLIPSEWSPETCQTWSTH